MSATPRADGLAPAEHEPAPVPPERTHAALKAAIQGCRACDLWAPATQPVMGEGSTEASVMLVGEQPGDREDIAGQPFVGPAGRILDEGLERAGIRRDDVYISNAVKHFRYRAQGKRRIHQKPDRWQVSACLPWLQAELEMVTPRVLVLLGATAAQSLLGSGIRIGRDRGKLVESELAEHVTLTAHPSSILRTRTEQERGEAMELFVTDLRVVARLAG